MENIYIQKDYELITFDLGFVPDVPDLMMRFGNVPLLTPLQRRYENLQPPLTNRLIEQAIAHRPAQLFGPFPKSFLPFA